MTHHVLRLLRKVHLYFGLLISPALIFFAFTGALQTFSLHESVQGSSYKPARWEMELAQLHKNQTTEVSDHHRQEAKAAPCASPVTGGDTLPSQSASAGHHHQHDGSSPQQGSEVIAKSAPSVPKAATAETFTGPTKRQKHLPLKIFFLIVSVGLLTSTLTGVIMAYKYTRKKWVVTVWLVAGIILPLLLMKF